MGIVGESLCTKCAGTGKWVNPKWTDDVRACFTCEGTGRVQFGQRTPKYPSPPRTKQRLRQLNDDFANAILDPSAAGDDDVGAEVALMREVGQVDVAEVARKVTEKIVPIIRAEVNDATGRTELAIRQEVKRYAEGLVAAATEEAYAKLAKRLPQRIELTRDGQPLPQVAGHQHPRFAQLLRMATSRNAEGFVPNVWITGPAGSGKTTGARMVAEALQVPFYVNGALETKFEATGYKDAAGHYHPTEFREAFDKPSVYLFDDIDGCDSNGPVLALNSALANNLMAFPDAKVRRHPDCIIIATANTWGLGATADYVGRIRFDAAFLDRFGGKLTWGYDEEFEVAISGNAEWARRVQRARAQARSAGLKVLVSPRATIAGAAYIIAGFSPDEAAEMTYLAGLSGEQRRVVQ